MVIVSGRTPSQVVRGNLVSGSCAALILYIIIPGHLSPKSGEHRMKRKKFFSFKRKCFLKYQ